MRAAASPAVRSSLDAGEGVRVGYRAALAVDLDVYRVATGNRDGELLSGGGDLETGSTDGDGKTQGFPTIGNPRRELDVITAISEATKAANQRRPHTTSVGDVHAVRGVVVGVHDVDERVFAQLVLSEFELVDVCRR